MKTDKLGNALIYVSLQNCFAQNMVTKLQLVWGILSWFFFLKCLKALCCFAGWQNVCNGPPTKSAWEPVWRWAVSGGWILLLWCLGLQGNYLWLQLHGGKWLQEKALISSQREMTTSLTGVGETCVSRWVCHAPDRLKDCQFPPSCRGWITSFLATFIQCLPDSEVSIFAFQKQPLDSGFRVTTIVFLTPEGEKSMSVTNAQKSGYGIGNTPMRLVLRSPMGAPEMFTQDVSQKHY